jgi:hypothetical protein
VSRVGLATQSRRSLFLVGNRTSQIYAHLARGSQLPTFQVQRFERVYFMRGLLQLQGELGGRFLQAGLLPGLALVRETFAPFTLANVRFNP